MSCLFVRFLSVYFFPCRPCHVLPHFRMSGDTRRTVTVLHVSSAPSNQAVVRPLPLYTPISPHPDPIPRWFVQFTGFNIWLLHLRPIPRD